MRCQIYSIDKIACDKEATAYYQGKRVCEHCSFQLKRKVKRADYAFNSAKYHKEYCIVCGNGLGRRNIPNSTGLCRKHLLEYHKIGGRCTGKGVLNKDKLKVIQMLHKNDKQLKNGFK